MPSSEVGGKQTDSYNLRFKFLPKLTHSLTAMPGNFLLNPVALDTSDARREFVALLKPYLPYSLPILGYIFHSSQPTHTGFGEPNIQVWTAKSDVKSDSPTSNLFSVVMFTPIDSQFRLFCSADSSSAHPTAEEEEHVVSTLQSAMNLIVVADPPIFRTIVPLPAPLHNHAVEDALDLGTVIFIGSVHEKWTNCLKPYSPKMNPCVKYLCPPSDVINAQPSRDGWVVTGLEEADIELVRATSGISRSREYVLERCPTSVCIRTQSKDAEGAPGRPIAWALMHADGSIGALHVEADYRRQGLGQFAMHELVRRCRGSGPTDKGGEKIADGGGALGWNWTDVVQGNEKGAGFMESLGGWKEGWLCYWVFLVAESV